MRLTVGARQSDLARWQAVQVAHAIEQLPEKPSIEFRFKSSLGDQNLDLPLASMPAKGVFTEDFYADLVEGRCDLVVHSWKDLPTEERQDTRIAMTLPRADMRDVLLVPEDVWQETLKTGTLKILTSSPRRVYNLSECLPALLPTQPKLEFVAVRGNVPTRIRKMHEQGAALVLAKAGLDRLLEAEVDGFLDAQIGLTAQVRRCRFQVLPVSLNPPAPAQGALAVEVLRDNEEANAICARLTDEVCFASVERERQVLREYGGGCHQKIGVAVIEREYGRVFALRGLTEGGKVLRQWKIENSVPWPKARSKAQLFPLVPTDNSWFDRKPLPHSAQGLESAMALFVARVDALPREFKPDREQIVWVAGSQTWRKLAKRGIWVNGSQDGLGEKEKIGLECIVGPLKWTKLTHAASFSMEHETIATYQLLPKEVVPNLRGKTHFYWMSRTSFERARQEFPEEVRSGYNSCSPGLTYEFLKHQSDLQHPVKVFIGLEQFLAESTT